MLKDLAKNKEMSSSNWDFENVFKHKVFSFFDKYFMYLDTSKNFQNHPNFGYPGNYLVSRKKKHSYLTQKSPTKSI